jgi:hypothetical protein
MTLPQTTNGIHYEVDNHNRQVFLLPIINRHKEEQVIKSKEELDAKYIFHNVIVNWQRSLLRI